jgi:hypothetical protein
MTFAMLTGDDFRRGRHLIIAIQLGAQMHGLATLLHPLLCGHRGASELHLAWIVSYVAAWDGALFSIPIAAKPRNRLFRTRLFRSAS